MLDEMPQSDTNDHGTTVPVRNMALPKHYSGKTPKVNLEEVVRKRDKYATTVFKVISRSRAVRAEVTVRWDGGRAQRFEMQDTACYDQKQAYDYIATVALFHISTTAVNKQLPLIFRDLWDELALKKKEEDDEAYRQQLKLYRSIAEPRVQLPPSRVGLRDIKTKAATDSATSAQDARAAKVNASAPVAKAGRRIAEVSSDESQRIMDQLADRQNWPSYQEMLVSHPREMTEAAQLMLTRLPTATTRVFAHRSIPLFHHEHD